jgi:hypothetical protein
MTNIAADIRASVEALCTPELATELLREFQELNERYYAADFRPSELSGARFSEAAFRICEHVCLKLHTPLGKQLPRTDLLIQALEKSPSTKATDSFRTHIPRALRMMYDFRSKRDVAHLGSGVSPNIADATLVLTCAGWVLAEIFRIGHKCDISLAQSIVDDLVDRRTPLLWTEGDVVRVLDPGLPFKEKVLLLLHHFQPTRVPARKLFEWVEYSNFSVFEKKILVPLHNSALIDRRPTGVTILPPGKIAIENVLRSRRTK